MPPYEEIPPLEEILKLADVVAEGRSRSYVSDALTFARWIRRDVGLILEENRKLKARVAELEGDEVYESTRQR